MFNFHNYTPQLKNFIPNNPQKSKHINCGSCGLSNLITYFPCEECGMPTCFSCQIRFNTGKKICNRCYERINQFNNQKTASKVDKLFAEIFSDTTYVSIKTAADENQLIDEFAGAILAILNDDNNIKIENGKLTTETINNINNSVVNGIGYPEL